MTPVRSTALLRAEIDAVLADWAWHLDHGELNDLAQLFTEDAFFVTGAVELTGRAAIKDRYRERTVVRSTRHIYSSLRVNALGAASGPEARPSLARARSTWVNYAANAPVPVDDVGVYLLDALAIDRAFLVGLSLGANIALTAAVLHPGRVRGLVLAAPGLPGYPWSTSRPPEAAADVARRKGIAAAKRFWLGHEIFRSAQEHPAARDQLAAMVGRFPAHQWSDAPAAAPLPRSPASWPACASPCSS